MIDLLAGLVLPLIGSVWILTVLFICMARLGLDNRISGRTRIIATATYVILAIFISVMGGSAWSVATMLGIPAFGYFMFNRSKGYFVYYCLLCTIVLIVDMLVPLVLGLFQSNGWIAFQSIYTALISLQLSLRITQYGVLQWVTHLIARKEKRQITKAQLAQYLILPIFSFVYLYTLIYFLNIYMSEEILILILVNFVLIALLNLYFTRIFEHLTKNNVLLQELALYRQQVDLQSKHYEQLEAKHASTRGVIHDIRNHIQALERLYLTEVFSMQHDSSTTTTDSTTNEHSMEDSRNKAGHVAKQYTQELLQLFNQLSLRYFCPDKHVNIILNDKADQMQRMGIEVDFKLEDISFAFMRAVDITTLFSNILDNAIEAAPCDGHRVVKLRVTKRYNWVSILLKNPTGSDIKKVNHTGLGLKNVQAVVHQYEGNLHTEWRDGYYYTRVLLGDFSEHHLVPTAGDANLHLI